ncbi:hypothetical protein [Aneurinibacillus sp. UBA3580]|uniref:hypothetical protein n=1 Tax=Aneurinibacillus sp. UBA3580 TaxID=1946041 RepID=UPI00257E72D4|nr:hypothetical protein [Aneurinibacillus sp. UBA3580]
MKINVFYSWQSDLPNNSNRSFINDAIKKAINKLSYEIKVFAEYDRDTLGTTGSPDISDTIFTKINKSDIFICDISIINKDYPGRKTPNPNVLVELGYAAKALGWEKVICLFNKKYGELTDVPFDINHRRILVYDSDKANEKQRVSEIFFKNISEMFSKGVLFNPLRDYVKGKIDYCFLEVLKHISTIVYDTYSMSDSLRKVTDLLNLEKNKLFDLLTKRESILGFFAYKNLKDVQEKLIELFNTINSSSNYPTDWAVTILSLNDWIRSFQWHISFRRDNPIFIKTLNPIRKFGVISAGNMNKSNRPDSYILLHMIDNEQGKVLNVGTMIRVEREILVSPFKFNSLALEPFCECIWRVIQLSNNWLDITGSEFILDPEYYHIGGPI